MIFVSLGTQKFQFDRLLKYIDEMISENKIKEEVFAQIGNSNYIPVNYKYVKFMNEEEFHKKIKEANLIISHAGVGTIITSINMSKKVIVVPRLSKYGEHVDDHQLEIAKAFSNKKLIMTVGENIEELLNLINCADKVSLNKYHSSNKKIQNIIDEFIQKNEAQKNKIKIAYIAKEMPINGISTVIMNYCRNLDLNKFEITVFSGTPIDNTYIEEAERIGIKIEKMPPKRGGNPLKYYSFLFKNISHKNFDIVHVHGNSATITVELMMAWIRGIKIRIAHCHNTTCDKKKIHKILKPLLKRIYTYGFACSEDAGKWMFDNKKFEVLPNGFNVKKFIYDESKRNEIRTELKLENKFVIGHVGMFNKQKNHQFLLKIFENVASKNENAYLLLIGNGPDFNDINDIIQKHPNKDRIICFGETNNVNDMYSVMDIFVFPSIHEGLGIVLLEAQINGMKCVASDVIPKEVKISKNFKFLSLNDSIERWTQEILENSESNIMRKDFYYENESNVLKYDIEKNSKYLEEKYIKLIGEING